MQGRKKEFESTLQIAKQITSRRRDGNTTRLADIGIQIIFSGNICVCLDHHENGSNRMANKLLFNKILMRLITEHQLPEHKLRVDRNRYHIELIGMEHIFVQPRAIKKHNPNLLCRLLNYIFKSE